MARLTVIIPFPFRTPTELFEETCASVLEFRPDGAEILVVNAGGYDDCYQIGEEEVRFVHAEPESSLIDCINLGIREADAPLVHPILCGVTAEEGWTDGAIKRFEKPVVSAVIPLILQSVSESLSPTGLRVRAGLVYARSGKLFPIRRDTPTAGWNRVVPTIGGAFFRREPLLDLGLFSPSFSATFAYADMTMLLDAIRQRTVIETSSRLHYQEDAFPGEPDRYAWLTEQERLFRRWDDWGGRTKNGWLHRFRLFAESWSALRHGDRGKVNAAYRAGRDAESSKAERLQAVANAKRARIARES